jgi:hypothetical protein
VEDLGVCGNIILKLILRGKGFDRIKMSQDKNLPAEINSL